MKIVAIDNFDRDWIPEHVEESGLTPAEAKAKCKTLNDLATSRSEWWYVVRADDDCVRTLESIT